MNHEAGNITTHTAPSDLSPGDSDQTPPVDDAKTHAAVDDLNRHSLKRRIVKGLAVVCSAQFLTQLMRFGSVAILSRLLFPEHYGLMAIVGVVLQGAALLSDVGIRDSIVHNENGDDPKFINTAWTLQVIRGLALWIALCIFAYPIALFYEDIRLAYLIPVLGFNTILQGCMSISIFTLARHVNYSKQSTMELTTQAASIVFMLILAVFWQSVWVLVLGSLLQLGLRCVISHFLIPGYRVKLQWDRTAAAQIFHYGKWIFIATLLQFALNQGDRLILAKLVGTDTLGVYHMAILLTEAIFMILLKVSAEVLFPTYARLSEKHERKAFRLRVGRLRGGLMALVLPPLWIMALFGREIIGFIFNEKYVEAGPVLQMIAVGAVGMVITLTANRITLARGDSKRHMIVQAARVILMLGCMFGFVIWLGPMGLFIGQAVARLGEYPFVAWSVKKHDGWFPLMDLAAFASSAFVIAGGWWLMDSCPQAVLEMGLSLQQMFNG